MEKKKETRNLIIMIVCIVVYLVCVAIQGKMSVDNARAVKAAGGAPQGNSAMAGVVGQIEVVATVVMTLFARKKGMIAAATLNGLNSLYLLIQMVAMGRRNALPGFVVNVITIGIAAVIYFYTNKSEQMTEELKESYQEAIAKNRIIEEQEESMKYMAYYDKLTGMPNRENFMERLEKQIKQSGDCVMIYIDLDDFRRINDNFGHAIGDELLKQYADKIKTYCGGNTFAAKIGGDEFGIILGNGMTNEAIFKYATGISGIFSEPISMGGNVYTVAASYGVASFPENAMTADDLFRCAETAMFNAKESGKNQLCFYTRQG